MNTWDVVSQLGLVVEKPWPECVLVYGSADPLPNPAELLLTQLVASRCKLGWWFFVYRHGKNLPLTVPKDWCNPPGVFNIENVIPQGITLGEMAKEIWRLREEAVIVAHLSDSTLRATSNPEKKWSGRWATMTIPELHERGGWLGGAGIHYILRLWAEHTDDVIFICPFQEKGRVYEIYKGVSRPLFIRAPFVKFVPPARLKLQLKLPDWAPAPWWYWRELPASFRRRVRKEVQTRLFSEERRIEIFLP